MTDTKFILGCFALAVLCFGVALALRGPGVFAVTLLAIMTIAIGSGTLRLMRVIRDAGRP